MDIVRAFECAGMAKDVQLNIQGTLEDPLFQANQIGKLLELANISDAIKDYGEDEKHIVLNYNAIGSQRTLFLTEFGLYRLLFASRKPIARPFQKWVVQVIKEIRITGKYEMSYQLTSQLNEKDRIHALQLVTQHDALMQDVDRMTKLAEKKATHLALLKSHADIPLMYLAEIGTLPDGRILLKFGESDDISTREPYLRKDYGDVYFVKLQSRSLYCGTS